MRPRERILEAAYRWQAQNPNPHCELVYTSPYQLLVSVVLSAQTTDKSVNRVMGPLYAQGFGPAHVLQLGQAGFLDLIRTIGLAPTKSRNVLRLTELLLSEHNGEVPRNREALEALPGVGRKTANVVLGELFGEPTLAVDTHVLRVGGRLKLHKETNPTKAETAMLKIMPREFLPKLHYWMVLHGRYVCQARKPKCSECLLFDVCPSAAK